MDTKELIEDGLREIGKAVLGKENVLRHIMGAILAGGHILIEDIPGVGKTTMAVAFSHALGLDYKRLQFTPDVLPSDITGFSMYDKSSSAFRYMPGAAMTNFFLADEINRASPKTQSALLEVMQEGKLSVDGETHEVPQPFIVMATENPFGSSGTQELPESERDRFMICITVGYPDKEKEIEILKGLSRQESVAPVLTRDVLMHLKKEVAAVHVDDSLYEYIVSLATVSRHHKDVTLGLSPRATMALTAMAKATAVMAGRTYVTPEDIEEVMPYTWGHRLTLTGKARMEGKTAKTILSDMVKKVPLPSLEA